MGTRPLLCGFLKVRNELLRGNLYRVLDNMRRYCDEGSLVVCDDASVDGTREYLQDTIPAKNLILVPPSQQDFRRELFWKQKMLERCHEIMPQWIIWIDGDEVLDRQGTEGIQDFAEKALGERFSAYRFPEVNLWRSPGWKRVDSQFDEGSFIRLWRCLPGLMFDVREGTHYHQFPPALLEGEIPTAPFSVLHYGNVAKSLVWKSVQYYGGLGGVDRHLRFPQAKYEPVPPEIFPDGAEYWDKGMPQPFQPEEIVKILELKNLKALPETFSVVIPAYNRAETLERAVRSVLAQTYDRWVLLLVDDGSTDLTWGRMQEIQEWDPRIFTIKMPAHKGGVAANEVGMKVSCEFSEWWSRLGSDDWWMPKKLEHDAEVLRVGADAVYGRFQVFRGGQLAELCSPPCADPSAELLAGRFTGSWANVAVATRVLKAVRDHYGNFVDPRLINMEDWNFGWRTAKLGFKWVWRGPENEADGIWVSAEYGASGSANAAICHSDEVLTRQIMVEGR